MTERAYLRLVDKKLRREAERRPRPGVPRPTPRRNSRTWQARVGKEPRVIVIALCALPSCGRRHSQRRPRFQASSRPVESGAYDLLPQWPAYCSTKHRMRAAYERRRDRTLARRVPLTVCAAPRCGRRIAVQRLRREGGRYVPRRGRPRRCCGPICRQRAYRAANPSPPPSAVYAEPCRSCGGRIAASGRPGRPPTRCADCRESMTAATSATSIVVSEEIEARRRADPEYAEGLRRNPGRR